MLGVVPAPAHPPDPDGTQGDGVRPLPRRPQPAGEAGRPRRPWRHAHHRPLRGARDGRPLLDDGQILDGPNVVWCTGFRQVFDWMELPIFDDSGWPVEYLGVVADAPGFYFCGLSFQYAFS